MKRLIIALALAVMLTLVVSVPVFAHNVGHVDNHTGCVDVGGGNHPPVGNGQGPIDPAGVHHAIDQGNSAVSSGSC